MTKLPVYPLDFNECRRNKNITKEEKDKRINEEIKRIIEIMKKDNSNNYSISFEDVLIIVDKLVEDDVSYYEISVAHNHHKTIMPN